MKRFSFLALAFAVMMFPACTESFDEAPLAPPAKPDPGKYLETYVQNDIIFQKTALVENSGVLNGLFITKSGDIHTFQMARMDNDFEERVVIKKYIESVLYHSTGVVGQVDRNDLLQNYRWNLISGRTQAENVGIKESEQMTTRYTSYVLATTYTTWSDPEYDCPIHHDELARTSRYLNVNLKQQGRLNSTNPGQLAGSVVLWLEDVLSGYEIKTENN